MAKIKCPYSYPHKSRQAKVDYICGLGGYSDRHDRVAIEFCVGLYHVDNDFDHIWEKVVDTEGVPEGYDHDSLKDAARTVFDPNAYYECAVEDAARSLQEGDDATYHMLWDGTTLNVKLELWGRGGKHLVITEFEGHSLRCSDDDLAEAMMLQDSDGSWYSWSTRDVNLLYKYVRQCAVDFTTQKASDEVEYQMAWRLHDAAVEKYDEIAKVAKDKATLESYAEAVSNALYEAGDDPDVREAWARLQIAAGISRAATV